MRQPNTSFLDHLLERNQAYLEGFTKWSFYPGMLFNSEEQWWGDKKKRPTPHEGIDLCYFEDTAGRIKKVGPRLQVPTAFAGVIVKMADDFLGKSIFIRHEIFAPDGRQLYTAFGHTEPAPSLEIGKEVAAGEIIAAIAAAPGKKTRVPAHLHLTCAWMPAHIPLHRLTWENLGRDPAVTLVDPLAILSHPEP